MTTVSNTYAVRLRRRLPIWSRLHRALRENKRALAELMAFLDSRGAK